MLDPMKFNIDFTLQLPGDPAFIKTFTGLLLFCFTVLFISILGRLILGKGSNLNAGIFAGMSILMMYGLVAIVFSLIPDMVGRYISCLPLGKFQVQEGQKILQLATLGDLCFSELCARYFLIFLLSYVICWLNGYTPGNLNSLGWVCFRFFYLFVAAGIYYGLVEVAGRFIPDFLKQKQVAVILLSVLGFSIIIALCKTILTSVQKVVGMLYDGFHNYFFKNKFGMNMVKAVYSTGVAMFFVRVLEEIGYTTIAVDLKDLGSYFPAALVLFILWLITSKLQ